MAAKHPFPKISDITLKFWSSEQTRDCYKVITRIDSPNVWDRISAANNSLISNEIFANLEETKRMGHSDPSWCILMAYFRDLARTGFPDRFLLKNQHLWVMGYYMPDYFPEVMFISGAGIIANLS